MQLENTANTLSSEEVFTLHSQLTSQRICKGSIRCTYKDGAMIHVSAGSLNAGSLNAAGRAGRGGRWFRDSYDPASASDDYTDETLYTKEIGEAESFTFKQDKD